MESLPCRAAPLPRAVVRRSCRAAVAAVAALGAVLGAIVVGPAARAGVTVAGRLPGDGTGGAAAPQPLGARGRLLASGRAAGFSGIVLPDLLVVFPRGLTAADTARLRSIRGVRDMITFDGARISVAGRPATVIGVSPRRFRSWVPLRAASDQRLWSSLAAGDFVAAGGAATRLGLARGRTYRLVGGSARRVAFGGSGQLGITGVDLLVNRAVSRRLGLVREVAALISAPGPAMTSLVARVRRALGPGARVVGLRGGRPPAVTSRPGQISGYLQLFRASAARYCPAMSWTVLAAIGQIESGDGRNVGPSSAGALGPMQFLPSTWAAWGIDGFGPPGPPDIMNPLDAVPSAARMLCAAGASDGTPAGLRRAIFAYNHAVWYVDEVLALAARYAAGYG